MRLGEHLLGHHFKIYSDVRNRHHSGKGCDYKPKGASYNLYEEKARLKICYIKRKEYSAPLQSLDLGETCVQKTFYRYNGRAGGLKQTETEGLVIYAGGAACICKRTDHGTVRGTTKRKYWHGNLEALPPGDRKNAWHPDDEAPSLLQPFRKNVPRVFFASNQ
jgi:hypothetical protein